MKNKIVNSSVHLNKENNMVRQNDLQHMVVEKSGETQVELLEIIKLVCKKVAPVWPLDNFVAVNPYVGLVDKDFETAALELYSAGGIQTTLPVSFYLDKIVSKEISDKDLTEALSKKQAGLSIADFLKEIKCYSDETEQKSFLSFADVSKHVTQKDWGQFMLNRISSWASSYFDKGQAVWGAANQNDSLFVSWKKEASIDLTPQIMGLKDFKKKVLALPDDPLEAAQQALKILGVPAKSLSNYLHCLLIRVGGWAAYAAKLDWENNLYNRKDVKLIEFLAVLICWEACLFETLNNPSLNEAWSKALKLNLDEQATQKTNKQLLNKLILQDAFDLSMQRSIIKKIQHHKKISDTQTGQKKAQAVFCIDVRSEVFRRNLEAVDSGIETLGFAGFFGFSVNYLPLASNSGVAQCPVLLKTGPTIVEEIANQKLNKQAVQHRVLEKQVEQVWRSFKTGAVTCFSFVSPLGLTFLPKLFTDSFGLTRPLPHPDTFGLKPSFYKNKTIRLDVGYYNDQAVGIPVDQQIQMAKNVLTAMSLTENFAKFVFLVGHGSTTVNNPHAGSLDCGACGGHTGEANAKVAAAVFNNPLVRKGLKAHNIYIPDNTVFLACLHDTTTDQVQIFNPNNVPNDKIEELAEIEKTFMLAGQASRKERSGRILVNDSVDIDAKIINRSKDWSQIRPEWGLAGCSSFIIAPREQTSGLNLEGKAFLHSYKWEKDAGFSVLEAIMTAPMIVTSWINLQYYASTVDNKKFGAGNKTLHNVTAGLGVMEGYSGDLRVGLPLQSVHDGEKFQHEPVKLNVIIQAPVEAINEIIKKHSNVRNLCDNGWLNILVMNEDGKISFAYNGNLSWREMNTQAA